jgi:DNA-binding NarL/FixJ family response regulator
MKSLRVLLFGFCNMAEYIFAPLVREIVGVREVETVYTMNDLIHTDNSRLVDILVFNAMAIGFNMDNQLQRMKLQFPEAFIICFSPHRLSDFICMKIVKNGIDVLLANIDCRTEYQRATAAIQVRRRYYPPVLRRMIEERTCPADRGYRFLSRKEHAMLVLTLKGLTLKEIANELSVAETTACTTRKNAFRKMGVRSLVELVKVGYQYNLNHVEESEHAM